MENISEIKKSPLWTEIKPGLNEKREREEAGRNPPYQTERGLAVVRRAGRELRRSNSCIITSY